MAGWPEAQRIGLGVMALQYARWGYAVVPCERGGKRPHQMLPEHGGVHLASGHPEQIRAWWSTDSAANIGVATGATSALAVIDVDVKNGAEGLHSLGELQRSYGLLTSYPCARTPSGGYHIWMRTPAGALVPERPGIMAGIDVKGNGGLVIAPPSARLVVPLGLDGEHVQPVPVPYTWEYGCPCSAGTAPSWMPGWLDKAPGTSSPVSTEPPPDLESLKTTGIEPGERNKVTYRAACTLFRRFGTTPEGCATVIAELRDVWLATDHRDFPWREVLVSVESARKFIVREQAAEQQMMASASGWLRSLGY